MEIEEKETDDTSTTEKESQSENWDDSDSSQNDIVLSTSKSTSQKKLKRSFNPNVKRLSEIFLWLDSTKNYLFCKCCNVKLSGNKFHLNRHDNSGGSSIGLQVCATPKNLKRKFKIN